MKTTIFLALGLAACLTSCTSYDITQAKVRTIQPGVTTETNLMQMFGPPDTRQSEVHGDTTLVWFRSEAPPISGYIPLIGQYTGGLNIDMLQLQVKTAPNGGVRNFSINESLGEVRSEKVQSIHDFAYGQ
jgi:hypothetical protein